jgi:hypothetical protein
MKMTESSIIELSDLFSSQRPETKSEESESYDASSLFTDSEGESFVDSNESIEKESESETDSKSDEAVIKKDIVIKGEMDPKNIDKQVAKVSKKLMKMMSEGYYPIRIKCVKV